MRVITYKTPKITGKCNVTKLVIDTIDELDAANSIIAISSKIISIAEGSVVPKNGLDKEQLIKQQSDYWLNPKLSKYGHHFTIKHHTLVGSAGIDTSNGSDNYVLLPISPQETANELREKLSAHYGVPVGIVITDSTSVPLRRGAVGFSIAHSGFAALKSYIGTPDLFGNEMQHSVANQAHGLAAAAVLEMGEGAEQTPIVMLSGSKHIRCVDKNPSTEELSELYPNIDEDLFEPFWKAVGWKDN